MQNAIEGDSLWTSERVDGLVRLWGEGKSASQIALALGNISRNAVIGKAHRLRLPARPSPIKGVRKEKKPGATILQLTERMCKWPNGDPRDADFHFCGKAAQPGVPYCSEHAAKAYQAPAKRGDDRRAAG